MRWVRMQFRIDMRFGPVLVPFRPHIPVPRSHVLVPCPGPVPVPCPGPILVPCPDHDDHIWWSYIYVYIYIYMAECIWDWQTTAEGKKNTGGLFSTCFSSLVPDFQGRISPRLVYNMAGKLLALFEGKLLDAFWPFFGPIFPQGVFFLFFVFSLAFFFALSDRDRIGSGSKKSDSFAFFKIVLSVDVECSLLWNGCSLEPQLGPNLDPLPEPIFKKNEHSVDVECSKKWQSDFWNPPQNRSQEGRLKS